MSIQLHLNRGQVRRYSNIIRKTDSRIEALRANILLSLHYNLKVNEITIKAKCVRATVYRTLYRYEDLGEDSIKDQRRLTAPKKVTENVEDKLLEYLDFTPPNYGWHRSSWTLELLALQIFDDLKIKISPRHIKNILNYLGCRRGKPRVALRIPVRGRRKILQNIGKIVKKASSKHEVLYIDEADIDLNPKIGLTYIKCGHQPLVLTPGKNVKRYIAGALNARTGKIIYKIGNRKNSILFIELLYLLSKKYRKAKKIHLVLDNYIIHKSRITKTALLKFKKRFIFHFLPPYSPDNNVIERLWKQLHDHVTRNHQYKAIEDLIKAVEYFLSNAQPFPGKKVSIIRKAA